MFPPHTVRVWTKNLHWTCPHTLVWRFWQEALVCGVPSPIKMENPPLFNKATNGIAKLQSAVSSQQIGGVVAATKLHSSPGHSQHQTSASLYVSGSGRSQWDHSWCVTDFPEQLISPEGWISPVRRSALWPGWPSIIADELPHLLSISTLRYLLSVCTPTRPTPHASPPPWNIRNYNCSTGHTHKHSWNSHVSCTMHPLPPGITKILFKGKASFDHRMDSRVTCCKNIFSFFFGPFSLLFVAKRLN